MIEKTALNKNDNFFSLSDIEKSEIDQQVKFELNEMQLKMVIIGGITNILSGIVLALVIFNQVKSTVLFTWYSVLVIVNVLNIVFSLIYKHHKIVPSQIGKWLVVYHIILAIVSITWGSIGILFLAVDLNHQLFIIAFLLAVLVGFSFGTITDFTASCISICCLLVPTIAVRIYLGVHSIITTGSDSNINLAFGICLFIVGLFLLIACFIGYRLMQKSFQLSFINVALSKKLENMNKFLEQRVKERTLELAESLEKVTYQATHDLLTELPNRRLMFDYMKEAIKKANETSKMFAIAFFSLNEIEKINDALGHLIGDLVIQNIAKRLKSFAEKKGNNNLQSTQYTITLSRRDEFVILMQPVTTLEEVETKAAMLFSVLDEPVYTKKQALKLTASIGVSIYPKHGTDIKTLFMNADAARINKKGGNSLSVYKTEFNADLYKQLELEFDLHAAVKNNEFILQYQPFVSLNTGNVCGMEALVRWIHPTLGFIPPLDFIQLAESNGVIIPLGEWVLRTACQQTKIWLDQGYKELKVSVNLSARQLRQQNIVDIVIKILKETGLEPKNVELELTESEAFKEDVIPILQRFTALGLGLSIDDFGTGYSGLTNLKLLNINKLKIDKSFVQDIETDDDSKAIVSNTIALAKKLNIITVAEGVETKEQLKFLRDNGCDIIQGYYFSRPLNADAFTELLISKRSLTPNDLA